MRPLRWGVLGVSEMVGRRAVLPALRHCASAEIVAIASRDQLRADREAKRFGANRAYGSYTELLGDPEIDAVYIPLPNSLHAEWAIKAMDAGRHVLCEKPLACSAVEAARMAAAASRNRVTLMEAHMTSFHPRAQAVIELARTGEFGELRSVRSVFTFPNRDASNHRWRPEMGGGCLLDVGVYCLAPMIAMAGEPVSLAARQAMSPSGVDATFSAWLAFADGVTGSFLASFEAAENQQLEITGTKASITINRAFTAGTRDRWINVRHINGRRERLDVGGANSYLAMIEHFTAVVRGETRPLRPPEVSLRTLMSMDRLRDAAAGSS